MVFNSDEQSYVCFQCENVSVTKVENSFACKGGCQMYKPHYSVTYIQDINKLSFVTNAISITPELGTLVEHIEVGFNVFPEYDNQEEVSRLIDLFGSLIRLTPNVKRFTSPGGFPGLLYLIIAESCNQNYWKQLYNIEAPQDVNPSPHYYSALLSIRNRVTYVILIQSLFSSPEYLLFKSRKSEFTQVDNMCYISSMENSTTSELDSVIDAYSNLKTVTFRVNRLTAEEGWENLQPYPHIDHVSAEFGTMTDSLFQYLLRKFPTSKQLSIRQFDSDEVEPYIITPHLLNMLVACVNATDSFSLKLCKLKNQFILDKALIKMPCWAYVYIEFSDQEKEGAYLSLDTDKAKETTQTVVLVGESVVLNEILSTNSRDFFQQMHKLELYATDEDKPNNLTQLEHLQDIKRLSLRNYSINSLKSDCLLSSLTHLELEDCYVSTDMFMYISHIFPSLNGLDIRNPIIYHPINLIYMPTTSIRYLTLRVISSPFCYRLTQGEHTKYYSNNVLIDQEQYESKLSDDSLLKFDIVLPKTTLFVA